MSAQLEEEKKQYADQLELVATSLKDDPDNAELVALKGELEQMVRLIHDSLTELKPQETKSAPAKKAPRPLHVAEKWSRESHPAFKRSGPVAEEKEREREEAIPYQVNDNVMARWVSGDKAYYPARITSVTGSFTAPIYTVKFKSYDTTETLRAKDIRPMAATKRKADGASAAGGLVANNLPASPGKSAPSFAAGPSTASSGLSFTASAVNNGIVLSAAAQAYPQAQQQAEDENPKKFKKIKAKKELEAGKSKWQEFTNKGKFGKAVKKDSMFRTPEGVKGRVGFTGSGQAMRKDPTRSRHVYQQNEELD